MFTVINRGELSPTTEHEFENFNSRLKGLWLTEHNEDGTHKVFLPAYIPNLDASKITSGIFPRANLPSQIAYEDEVNAFTQANTFSQAGTFSGGLKVGSGFGVGSNGQFILANTLPTIDIYESDAGVDLKYWRHIIDGAVYHLQTVNDAYSVAADVYTVDRSGNIVFTGKITERARTAALGEWTAYTPTWTNLTIGNASNTGKFTQVGRTVFFKIDIIWGNTTSITAANVQVNFPVNAIATSSFTITHGEAIDASTGAAFGLHGRLVGATTQVLLTDNGASLVAVSATVPFTWTTSDELHLAGFYEI